MATRDIVPRANNEGGLGTEEKRWKNLYAENVYSDSLIGEQMGNQGVQGNQGNQGNQGYQGNQGDTGGGYLHTQTEASASWAVTHNLGSKYVNVEVIDSGHQSVSPQEITFVDTNSLTITFPSAVAGYAVVSFGGATGDQGTQGNQGNQGYQGNQGDTGSTGSTGSQGSQGVQGNQGNQGDQGGTGPQGNQGNQGYQGDPSTVAGPQGNQGNAGPQGNQGNQGDDASMIGPQGNQGNAGAAGSQGNQGALGAQGNQGNQGVQGAGASFASAAEINTGTEAAKAIAPDQLALASRAKLVQVAHAVVTALISGSTVMPIDDTIPQNTEGFEIITCAITPKNVNNLLVIVANTQYNNADTSAANMGMALFQDATANALAAVGCGIYTTYGTKTLMHKMAAGTTSETTFKIRFGGNAANTHYLNGVNGATGRIFGGVAATTLTIFEYAP